VTASALFVRRPVAAVLLTVGILLLGIVAYRQLPIAAVPNMERPTIGVFARLPGASPETMASSLVAPLERELGTISGVVEMVSFNATGAAVITLQFSLDKSIDAAAAAVQAAINRAAPALPSDLPQPPYYFKSNPGGFPIIALAMTSEVMDSSEVYEFADSVVAQSLAQVEGVAKVFISGAERRGVRIQVDPRVAANMNVSLEAIRIATALSTTNGPVGAVSDGQRSFMLAMNSQLLGAAEYADVIVAWRDGNSVQLADIASIKDDIINRKVAGWLGTRTAVVLWVLKQPEANVVQTVDKVLELIPRLSRVLPPAVNVDVVYDRTLLIRASIADVQATIAIAIVLVVLVIALFIRRFWATIIPSVTIPVALAATFAVMQLCGFSLNNLSLLALTIAVGFVVDDAVIIIENITRLIRQGERPLAAAVLGTRQMAFTVLSITAALVAALIPVLFMPDIVGRLFREFGLTLVAAVVASAIISLTLTPMMCGHLLRWSRLAQGGRVSGAIERIEARLVAGYLVTLDGALRHRSVVLALAAGMTVGTIGLYWYIPKGFIPTQDTGILRVRTVAPANISFAAMSAVQRAAADTIAADPAVAAVTSFIGSGNGQTLSNGTMLINLKPLSERKLTVSEVVARLRGKLGAINGVRSFLTPLQDISVGAQATPARYQYTVSSADGARLLEWSEAMRRRMMTIPEITDVISNAETVGLEAAVEIDRVRAASMGITPLMLDNTLYDALGQRQIRTIWLPRNYSRVILELDPQFQAGPANLNDIYVPSVTGNQVPLAAFASLSRRHSPVWSYHVDQNPAITISFNTPLGVSIDQAMQAIRAAEAEAQPPDGVISTFRGEAREAAESTRKQPLLFLAAIIVIYIILGILYESFAHPLTILSTLPSAAFGALIALIATKTEFTIVTSIACILLVGIVMKNAIMMVDFALEAERNAAIAPELAIRQAAGLRFRPILMTTLAALFGALPLAFDSGPGFELRQPLGIAIVGGLAVSQLLTLYTTPSIYLVIDRLRPSRRREMPADTMTTA
jgi:multidrug efflux pump